VVGGACCLQRDQAGRSAPTAARPEAWIADARVYGRGGSRLQNSPARRLMGLGQPDSLRSSCMRTFWPSAGGNLATRRTREPAGGSNAFVPAVSRPTRRLGLDSGAFAEPRFEQAEEAGRALRGNPY